MDDGTRATDLDLSGLLFSASEAGDFETTRLVQRALYGTNRQRVAARRQLAKAVRS